MVAMSRACTLAMIKACSVTNGPLLARMSNMSYGGLICTAYRDAFNYDPELQACISQDEAQLNDQGQVCCNRQLLAIATEEQFVWEG